MEHIGIYNTTNNRKLIKNHLNDVLNDSSNVIGTETRSYIAKELPGNPKIEYTTTTKESFFMEPGGGVKLETVWDGDRLLTVIIKSGK